MRGVCVFFVAIVAFGQAQKTSLLPDHHLDAIVGEASGESALDTVIGLGRYHRVPATPDFHEGASYILSKAKEYGLDDAHIEAFPADGKTTYNTFRSYLSWEVSSAVLTEVAPRSQVIGDFSKNPIVLADYSGSADVSTDLVDVGTGTSAKDYLEKDVRGKIVLAGGQTDQVQRAAVERGAVGILSYFPNQDTTWIGEFPNLVRWGHLSYYNPANKFAFMISQGQAREFRTRLAGGEQIRLRAQVSTKRAPGAFDVVTATIPGADPEAGEIVFSCHLDHQKPSANDNASGCATILEDGRILAKLIREGALTRPRRTIRFVWPPEIAGTTCFLARHPEIAARIRAVIHMDMVGGDPRITHSVFHITRTPASIPSFVNDVAEVFGEYVIDGSMRLIMDADGTDSILALQGGKDALWADFTPFSMGSDHQIYESSFHIPSIYLRDSPDMFIHTDGDRSSNLDATKLRRVAVIGAASGYFLASAGPQEARPLAAEVFARGGKRQSEALRRALAEPNARESSNLVSEAARQEREALASILQLAPEQRPLVDSLIDQVNAREAEASKTLAVFGKKTTMVEGSYNRVIPRRNPGFDGVLDVVPGGFAEFAGQPLPADPFTRARDREIITYDALNLVDGRRSVAQIRNILSAAYGAVAEEALFQYFKQLESLKVVTMQ